jgi:hypothetical protein
MPFVGAGESTGAVSGLAAHITSVGEMTHQRPFMSHAGASLLRELF